MLSYFKWNLKLKILDNSPDCTKILQYFAFMHKIAIINFWNSFNKIYLIFCFKNLGHMHAKTVTINMGKILIELFVNLIYSSMLYMCIWSL